MNKTLMKTFTTLTVLALLSGCATTTKADTNVQKTVEITDAKGKVKVPFKPNRVVALDNRTFETLDEWKIELAAAPKPLMPKSLSYTKNEKVKDIGNHREPNLEAIAQVNPDLVIVGQRFASYYDQIKKLVPQAAVISLDVTVDESAKEPDKALVNGLKNNTTILGTIFDKEKEAKKLNSQFDAAIKKAKSHYDPSKSVMSLTTTGGEITYVAPHYGRVWGPLYDIFNWKSALTVDQSTSTDKGDDVSVEAIAKSNPDYIVVLDRDAAISTDSDQASDIIAKASALQNVKAVKNNAIVYAPNDTYTNESIQTYIKIMNKLDTLFTKK